MATPSEQPHSEGSKDPKTPPANKGGGGFFSWFLLIAIVGGGSYAYFQGWLDKPIAWLNDTTQEDSAPALQPAAPAQRQQTAIASANLGEENLQSSVLAQMEAFQSRMIKLENQVRSLEAISENLADQLDRQSGEITSAPAQVEVSNMQLELIDLRLRISGDTLSALRGLENLANQLPDDSQLLPIINANLARIREIPTRTDMLALFTQLEQDISTAKQDVQGEIEELTEKRVVDNDLLNSLFSVREDDSHLREELILISGLANAVPPTRVALLQGLSTDYAKQLAEVRNAADALSSRFASVQTTKIAQTLATLTSIGFPDVRLIFSEGS